MWILIAILLVLPQPLLGREPSLGQVQERAVQLIGYQAHDMDQWKKRSRWAAAVPRLQTGFARQLRDVVSLTSSDNVSISGGDVLVGPTKNTFDQNVNQATTFEVKALWELGSLVFNRDELAVSHERREWMKEKKRILREVTESYLAWRRLLKELRIHRDPFAVHEKKKMLLDQARALLDAHTEGWFSQEIEGGDR